MLYPYPEYCGTGRTELTEVPGTTGMKVVQNLEPEVAGTGMKVFQNFQEFRVLWHGRTELTGVPGRYENAVPVPRVFVALAYRTSRTSGYGYECPRTGFPEVPGKGKNPKVDTRPWWRSSI